MLPRRFAGYRKYIWRPSQVPRKRRRRRRRTWFPAHLSFRASKPSSRLHGRHYLSETYNYNPFLEADYEDEVPDLVDIDYDLFEDRNNPAPGYYPSFFREAEDVVMSAGDCPPLHRS